MLCFFVKESQLNVCCVDDSVVLPFWSTKPQDKPVEEAEAGFAMLSL